MRLGADHPLQLVLGLTVWFVWFCAVYGGVSVACAVAPPPPGQGALNWVNGALLALTLATTLLLAWAAWTCGRAAHPQTQMARTPKTARAGGAAPAVPATHTATRRFIARAGAALHATAAVSTVVVGLPLALLPPCV